MAYDFHYTTTGTGVISGKEVLEQTEDAINDLGNTAISGVQEALDKAEQALTNSENAVDDAQTALNTANNAEGVAIQAQTDVGNLSGTVTNIGNRVTTAEGNISNLQGRMTTAEGNITNLQGRMTTAESNIGNLQTAVSTAQATANSAQQTATTARQQSYVFRYSGTAITNNSTIAYSTIDNTDNIKSGDKILDVDGKLFEITAVDTANQTVTVGTALIDLALDGNVVHLSGNETISGDKVFNNRLIKNVDVVLGTAPSTGKFSNIDIADNNKVSLLRVLGGVYDTGNSYARFFVQNKTADDGTGLSPTGTLRACGFNINLPASSTSEGQGSITPRGNKTTDFGLLSYQWRNLWCEKLFLNGTQLDPSAFALDANVVHTSGHETITGNKTFGNGTLTVNNSVGTNVHGEIKLAGSRLGYIVADNAFDGVFDNAGCGISILLQDAGKPLHIGAYKTDSNGRVFADNTDKKPILSITGGLIQTTSLVPENDSTGSLFRILSRLDYANGDPSKTLDVRFQQNDDADATSIIYSNADNKTSLGTASKKWKDVQTNLVNGLTPSSLSLPVAPSATSYVDISGYITVLDSSSANTYTPPSNGYITFEVTGNVVQIFHAQGLQAKWMVTGGVVNKGYYPVVAGVTYQIYVTASSVDKFWFIPCQGNI